jgi:SAM-dependent methyltransferase
MAARTIHPFPARMAPEIALDAIPQRSGRRTLTVIDPMCGSGTVLSAAVSRGHRAIGVDIDPLAVLMSQVATAHIDTESLVETAQYVCSIAEGRDGTPPWSDVETATFVNFWFGQRQKRDLVALTTAISAVEDEGIRSALRVALSRIIITKAPAASLAADTSHSRPHRVLTTSDYQVLDGFLRSVTSLKRLLDARQVIGAAIVTRGDSRILEGIRAHSVDMAVTSPPYLNALDYLRGHKLALVWFGYSIPTLRRLRGASIGAERAPDSEPSDRINELVSFIQQDVFDPDLLPMGTLQRFAGDLVEFTSAIRRVLKKNGRVVLVVGNSTLRGNYIRNDVIAGKCLQHAGFALLSRTEREIPEARRYMAINTRSAISTIRNRMRSEVVLTMSRTNA